jgi:hypothetical protein
VLAFGTQVRGFKTGQIFKSKKILSTPSFRGEVKLSHAACKISLNGMEAIISAKSPHNILAHSSTFQC